ncbi:MAG: type II toxin-antitoxin system HicA family toxin [Candidatus Gottesmanbacteria bacterium]|nr:type II toxin-antitoxin system HicA family toxin [Candidatus Gottesmanbacteria bacterium]
MALLRQIKPRQIEMVLVRKGFIARTTKSSHVVYRHPDGRRTIVPRHNKPVRIGTFMAILRQAEISKENFLDLL